MYNMINSIVKLWQSIAAMNACSTIALLCHIGALSLMYPTQPMSMSTGAFLTLVSVLYAFFPDNFLLRNICRSFLS